MDIFLKKKMRKESGAKKAKILERILRSKRKAVLVWLEGKLANRVVRKA